MASNSVTVTQTSILNGYCVPNERGRPIWHATQRVRGTDDQTTEDLEMRQQSLNALGLTGLLAVMFATGYATATPPPGAPRADGPVIHLPGSSWVIAVRASGSLGSEDGEQTIRARGEQTWQGRKVYAYEGQEETSLVEFPSRGVVARLRGSTPLESWDPPNGWNWPIWVGKSWTNHFRITNHRTGQTGNVVQGTWKVEAHEDIKVPAGTFRVFRVSYHDVNAEHLHWWSPELGISVKLKWQRTVRHLAGPGTREWELVSHDIRK